MRSRLTRLLSAAAMFTIALPTAVAASPDTTAVDVPPVASGEIDLRRMADLDRVALALPDRSLRSATPAGDPDGGYRPSSVPSDVDRSAIREAEYVDLCGDSRGRNDIRRLIVGESSEHQRMYFGSAMCAPVSTAELVLGAVEFYLWSGATERPDYGVVIDADVSGRPRVTVVHTPYDDPSTWRITYEGTGQLFDDGYEIGGVLPVSALHHNNDFAFGAAAWSEADTPIDDVPERDAPPLLFPYSCSIQVFSRAAVTPEPGREGEVRSALAAAGYPVVGSGPTFEVQGVADLAEVRDVDGVVRAERPADVVKFGVPSDPDWRRQWQLDRIAAPTAWQHTSKSNVTIAVVDDGVDSRRADLAGRVATGWDSWSGRPIPAGTNSDLGAHGTAVAGFAAAAGDNGRELTGVDWGARIAPFRVFDASGCATSTILADGIRRAAGSGAPIMNLSVGSTRHQQEVADAIAYAVDQGVLVVAAVGNDATSGAETYPAALPGVLAVGATTAFDTVAGYSNRGSFVDIAAPGGEGSTRPEVALTGLGDRGTELMQGTSFSAPLVAGAAALYLGLYPKTSASQLTSALTRTARDVGPTGRDDGSGHGILDVGRLVSSLPTFQTTGGTGFDGDPATTERLDTTDAFRASITVSRQRFEGDAARHVVLARHDAFADALSGSALTGEGPLLYSFTDRLPDITVTEMRRALPPGGRVYLLGGRAALSERVVEQVRQAGLSPKRLHGRTRFETSVAVANEVLSRYPGASKVLIARGDGAGTAAWADAIAGGGYAARARVPVLLSPSAALDPAGSRWLDEHPGLGRVILGGTAALSPDVERRAGGKRHRVAGTDRYATAVAIADQLWRSPTTGARSFVIVNSHRTDGWYFGLVGAGLSADNDAPILAVGDANPAPQATRDRVASCATPQVDLYLLGSEAVILPGVEASLDGQDPRPC